MGVGLHQPPVSGADRADRDHVRLAELVGALSLGIDLGFGQPLEHVMRQCLIALRLAEHAGFGDELRADVYYTALLINVGCHTDAHEQARWFGDDIATKRVKYDYELGSVRMQLAGMSNIGAGHPPLHRFKVGLEFLVSGHKEVDHMIEHHAAMARSLGEQLSLPEGTLHALGAAYEQWDGKGWPGELSGADVPMPARISQIAEFVEVCHRVRGVEAAREMVRRRAGRQFDPNLAAIFDAAAEAILEGLDAADTWEAVIAAEPALARVVSGERFEAALLAIANFIDLKSPFAVGHAPAVAELAAGAARHLGLPEAEVRQVRRAALVLGFGRMGVSNSIWDKPAGLGAGEWERVRMSPYLTERMLSGSESLSPLGAIAVQHRERLDGSGYPRGLSGAAISRPARILAAADAYQAMREPRPHRAALSPEGAASQLRAEVGAGRLDGDAVEAVLAAAGHRVPRRRTGPAGLTAREVEVLQLLAQGLSNKEIALRLTISPKTAGTHIEHIYAKIGARSRARASLFALQQGLLPEEELVDEDVA